MKHEILIGLTTTPKSDWRGKVEEMKKFGIKRIALFPTFLEIEQRKELYKLLDEIEGLEIPHVHLRGQDMDEQEINWFKEKGAKVFNIHPKNSKNGYSDGILKFASMIFIENLIMVPTLQEMQSFAGICLDFSHWENNQRLGISDYNDENVKYNDAMMDRVTKFKIGCAHVSAVQDETYHNEDFPGGRQYDKHWFDKLKEFDYMKQYLQYLPEYVSLEIENSFAEQLEVKRYLENKLGI